MSNVNLCTIFLTHDSFKLKLPLKAQRLLHIKYHINSNTNLYLSEQKLDYPLYHDRGFWLNTFTKLRISNKELFLIPTTKSSSSSFVALVGAQGRYIVSPNPPPFLITCRRLGHIPALPPRLASLSSNRRWSIS